MRIPMFSYIKGGIFGVCLGKSFPRKTRERGCFCKSQWLQIPEIEGTSFSQDRGGGGVLVMQRNIGTHWFFWGGGGSIQGRPRINGTVDTVDFQDFALITQLISSLCWIRASISHYNNIQIIIWLKTFHFMRHLLWTVIFVICPISRVSGTIQIIGLSQKWQSIRNYS